MLWILVIFPLLGMTIIIVIAVLLGKRDRKREAEKLEAKKKDMLETNPKQAVLQYLDENRHISEYTFIDLQLGKAKVDVLYISRKGIFLIYALKNEGTISGEVDQENWLNKTHDEYLLKNPMYNNKRDIEIISNVTTLRTNIYSLTVCTKAEEINIVNNEEYQVVKLNDLKETLDRYPGVITENDLVIFYNNIVNAVDQEEE